MQAKNENQIYKEVIAGLTSRPKTLPSKYLYDQRGITLFDKICELAEYYVTRTEMGILQKNIFEIVFALGKNVTLFEFGSGSSKKTEVLLSHLDDVLHYVPIDISPDYLRDAQIKLNNKFPGLSILPLCQDFCGELDFVKDAEFKNRVAFFPGSTIGNFSRNEVSDFLSKAAKFLGPKGKLLIGVDAVKDKDILEKAYNDAEGITRDFNLNILHRLNKELHANFKVSSFQHYAIYNDMLNRIEMHLKCMQECTVFIGDKSISFVEGETIHTENSHKYRPEEFILMACNAGFSFMKKWTDECRYFNVFMFEVR